MRSGGGSLVVEGHRVQTVLDSGGDRVAIDCRLPWVTRLLEEGAAGELRPGPAADASIGVRVEADRGAFDVRGWEPLTRGAWVRDGEVVLENACTGGFDLHARCSADRAHFIFRWRPPVRDRLASGVMRSRFHLLARSVLLQYPVLWWAGTKQRAPLHASVCVAETATPLLAGPGGIGKSTLLAQEVRLGSRAASDNLCVGDGLTAWGVVEPLRIEGAGGRRMPHGRGEATLDGRVSHLVPDRVVVLRRGTASTPVVGPCAPEVAERALITGTYMAGELRRFWAFAGALAAGTGLGPPHPPVARVAAAFAERLPCLEVVLPGRPGARLADLVGDAGKRVWV